MTEDRVALSDLGAGSQAVRDVLKSGRPMVITSDDGAAVAAIVDAGTYQSMLDDAATSLLRDLTSAAVEADAGQVIDHRALMQQIKERFAGRVPPVLLDQFNTA